MNKTNIKIKWLHSSFRYSSHFHPWNTGHQRTYENCSITNELSKIVPKPTNSWKLFHNHRIHENCTIQIISRMTFQWRLLRFSDANISHELKFIARSVEMPAKLEGKKSYWKRHKKTSYSCIETEYLPIWSNDGVNAVCMQFDRIKLSWEYHEINCISIYPP